MLLKTRLLVPILALLPCSLLFAAAATSPLEKSGSILGLIIFALIAVGFSFLCSIAEAVLLSVTPSHIAMLKEEGKPSAKRLQKLKENIDRPLSAILSLNTIAHTVGAAGVGAQAAGIWGNQAVGWASAAMTLVILVFSEIIPKTIGAVYWRALAPLTARLVRYLIIGLYPLVLLSDLITRAIGGRGEEVVTREEVAAMAALSEEKGELESRESRILDNLFRLRALTAHDILTPRPVVIAFREDLTVAEAMAERDEMPVSRIPIYRDTIDHVTGFVLKTDILLAKANDKSDTKLHELRRDMETVAADTRLSELLDFLLEKHAHLALVIDEYGGMDGIVTVEDLIETLLGMEIVDEADETPDMQSYARRQWEQRAAKLGLDLSILLDAGTSDDEGDDDGKGAPSDADNDETKKANKKSPES